MSVTGHITCRLMALILARFHPPLQDRAPAPARIKPRNIAPAIVNKLIFAAANTDEASGRLIDSRYGDHGIDSAEGKIVYY